MEGFWGAVTAGVDVDVTDDATTVVVVACSGTVIIGMIPTGVEVGVEVAVVMVVVPVGISFVSILTSSSKSRCSLICASIRSKITAVATSTPSALRLIIAAVVVDVVAVDATGGLEQARRQKRTARP